MAQADQMIRNDTTPGIPLVRLSAINPFLKELVSRDIDPTGLLAEQGLPTQIPASGDLFVSALCMYSLVEHSAVLANDPYLGVTIGSQLDLLTWEPIAKAAAAAATVGDLLNRFVLNAKEHASSVQYSIQSTGNRTTFMFKRVVQPSFDPAQNDAFYLGIMDRLMKGAAGIHWNPGKRADHRVRPIRDSGDVSRAAYCER